MITALICGTSGVLAAFWLGINILELPVAAIIQGLFATGLAGFIAVLTVVNGVYVPWVKKYIIVNTFMTWVVFLSIYFGITILFSPRVFTIHDYSVLIGPFMFSTGYIIIIFGPVQDRITRRRQLKGRAKQ